MSRFRALDVRVPLRADTALELAEAIRDYELIGYVVETSPHSDRDGSWVAVMIMKPNHVTSGSIH